MSESSDASSIKALTFDVFGTAVDRHSSIAREPEFTYHATDFRDLAGQLGA